MREPAPLPDEMLSACGSVIAPRPRYRSQGQPSQPDFLRTAHPKAGKLFRYPLKHPVPIT